MIHDFIIIGCGVSGIMAAQMVKKRTNKFLILERGDKIGGIWESYSKDHTCLQHNSSMYLLDSYFHVPGKSLPPSYASRNFIMKRLKEFIIYHKLIKHIKFRTNVNSFTEKDGIITVKVTYNGSLKTIKTRYLFVCTGNLSVPRSLGIGDNRIINYAEIKDYDKYFKGKKSLLVIGAGASGVEACLNAIRHNIKDITMLYNNNLGFYFNNWFLEYLFTIIHILPKRIANYIYIKIQYMMAASMNLELPPYIGNCDVLHPFSTRFIKEWNKGRIRILKNTGASVQKKLIERVDGVIETIGFDHSLSQFKMHPNELYNLNTKHINYDNIYFIGLNRPNTGTTPYSNYILLCGIMDYIDKGINKVSNIDDVFYTPNLFIRYFMDLDLNIYPFFDIIGFWLYSLWLHICRYFYVWMFTKSKRYPKRIFRKRRS